MNRRPGVKGGIAVAAFALIGFVFSQPALSALDATQARGKQIYLHGTSDSGEDITATVGNEGLTLPASSVPCASCHGRDGLGRREGGVIPPDIRWSELTKVYGHVHENGRKHDAFSEVSLARLIRSGRDPAHNQIDSSMPRYAMGKKDMQDLLAYLNFLEHDADPGLEEKRIQIGTLLPLRGPRAAVGQAMAQVLLAQFREINKDGGIYGRQLELLAIPHGDSPSVTVENLKSAFTKEGLFAMVGAYTVGVDDEVLEVLRQEGAPLVGPFTLNPGDQFMNPSSFYMYPGFDDQARVLVQLAQDEKGSRVALVAPEGQAMDRVLNAAGEVLPYDDSGISDPLRYESGRMDGGGMAEALVKKGANAVLFLGNHAELMALMKALDERGQAPRIYLLSAFIAQPLYDAPAAFDKRIFLAYPTLSKDMSMDGRNEYLRLADMHALPRDHLQSQIAAFAASKLMIQGLRGAGSTLTREKLVKAIEALYRYDTGVTPPLTYGPNRRVGARGAHVMVVDLEKKTNKGVGEWREVK